jgi:REP element-mobilizing transposase RayT
MATTARLTATPGYTPHPVPEPLAYFITFRTYGTWLPGDPRGTVDAAHRTPGELYADPDPAREARARRISRAGGLVLDDLGRECVDSTIREGCRRRGWQLAALNVRTNHVHVVVSAPVPPERVMADLKAWGTRQLVAEGHVPARKPVWSRHGSTRWIWREEDLDTVTDYVLNRQ